MPVQGPQWTEFLSCHVCFSMFDESVHRPISLGCGHTICKKCLANLQNGKCPFDQSLISRNVDDLPANYALLQLVGAAIPDSIRDKEEKIVITENKGCYETCNKCIEDLAVNLKTDSAELKSEGGLDEEDYTKNSHMGNLPSNSLLSRPMQRKLVSLVNCQLIEEEGRSRAMRAARSLGERAVTELILQHQNPHQLSQNLWAAVRTRGCQFLGPAMQEEVLKLILLVLEDASALSRKVLVLFVVQQLEESYPQASKTAIGHVVQLLYRASCFKVTKREEESSLMQLKEEFRTYEALRREHDSQIVQIAMEAGLRISPEQWSSLLYGDTTHKSHMQSIIDKLQTPQSFTQSINELSIALQRTGDPCNLQQLKPHLEFLANVDPSADAPHPTWENLEAVLKALRTVVQGLIDFFSTNSQKKNELLPLQNARYKTSMCRDQTQQGMCPRGNSCTFAHSQDELERYRARSKRLSVKGAGLMPTFAALSPKEKAELDKVNKLTSQKLANKQTEAISQSKLAGADKNLKNNKEASLIQSMANVSLNSRIQPPADRLPTLAGANSGIPKGNTTPSVAAPAHYRTPSLGAGPSVKETYFHPRMPQGATRMTPFEMEGHRYNNPGYVLNAPSMPGPSVPPGQYAPMNYQKHEGALPGAGYPPNPYLICDHQRNVSGAEQWATQQHCYGQSDAMYGAHVSQLSPHGSYPAPVFDHQPYNQGTSYQTPAPTAPPYANQGREYLNNLHDRRNKILAHLQHQGNSPRTRQAKQRGQVLNQSRGYIKEEAASSPSTALAKSVADTYVAARTMFSLATSGFLMEPQSVPSSYVPWSSDDSYDSFDMNDKAESKIDPCAAWVCDSFPSYETHQVVEDVDVAVDEDDVKSLFSWFEEESEKIKSTGEYSSSLASSLYSDSSFIPFDPPLVSRFGPISRMSRSRLHNTDPVQVTADETIKRMTPVTAVKAMECPLPIPAQVPSRFCVHEMPTYDSPAIPTGQEVLSPKWHNSPESQFMLQSDPTRLSRHQVQQEVARLENRAQDACSRDESLAYELQAIDLKISLQTGKKPPSNKMFTQTNNVSESSKLHSGVRASDPALTVEEQRKLHELATTIGSAGKHGSEQQERLLSQLLKLQDLSKQSSQKLQIDCKILKM